MPRFALRRNYKYIINIFSRPIKYLMACLLMSNRLGGVIPVFIPLHNWIVIIIIMLIPFRLLLERFYFVLNFTCVSINKRKTIITRRDVINFKYNVVVFPPSVGQLLSPARIGIVHVRSRRRQHNVRARVGHRPVERASTHEQRVIRIF